MKTVIENDFEIGYEHGQKIWNDWTRMWNGETGLSPEVVGSRFDLFVTAVVKDDPATITDDAKVAAWIGRVRDSFTSIHYSTVAGPFVDTVTQVVSCYWEARGVYAGKTGSPEDQPGKSFHIMGMDILQLRNGKIAECRTISGPARPE